MAEQLTHISPRNRKARVAKAALLALSAMLPALAHAQDAAKPSNAAAPVESAAAAVPATAPDNAASCLPAKLFDNVHAPYRVWGSADFLVWKIPSAGLPSLASTLPVGGVIVVDTTNALATGPLQNPQVVQTITNFTTVSVLSTPTLAGGNSINGGEQLGGRFTAGVWFYADESLGLEGSFFYINNRSTGFNSTTANPALPTDQFLLRFPFSSNIFVVGTSTIFGPGTITQAPSATPGQTFPSFVVRRSATTITGTSSSGLWGGELNARRTWYDDTQDPLFGQRFGGLIGFRYVDFHEDLFVSNAVQFFQPLAANGQPEFPDRNGLGLPLNTNLPTNLDYSTQDAIRTTNHFYGGQIGFDWDMYYSRLSLDIRADIGLGVMHQTIDVFGATQTSSTITLAPNVFVNPPPSTTSTSTPGGLFSSALDQGRHTRNRIAFIPDVNVKLGYQVFSSLRAYVGYDFLYLSSVARPGNQTALAATNIQATVGGTPTTLTFTQPAFRYDATGLAVNGFNFGVEYRY
jgi:Putative beta barrel porin-7 (BBP7)